MKARNAMMKDEFHKSAQEYNDPPLRIVKDTGEIISVQKRPPVLGPPTPKPPFSMPVMSVVRSTWSALPVPPSEKNSKMEEPDIKSV